MKKKSYLIIIAISLIAVFLWAFRFLLIPSLWNFLIVNDGPRTADVIVVLSGDMERARYGVTLLQSNYSDKILFTGSSAQRMNNLALSLGVTEDRILIDDKSSSTFTNAKNTLEILRNLGKKSALIVTSDYHTRRARIIFRQLSQGIAISICAVPEDLSHPKSEQNIRRELKIVISEYLKLVWHYIFER